MGALDEIRREVEQRKERQASDDLKVCTAKPIEDSIRQMGCYHEWINARNIVQARLQGR